MRRALFLDRDGTLIIDQHYLSDPAGVVVLPGVPEALRRARDLGYRLYLFTNQSGIGRGYLTLENVRRCNERMLDLLGLGGDLFAGECIAPEVPDAPSKYRKPSPAYLLETIAADQLDPTQCYMIGDKEADVNAGLAAHIHAIALCTGKHDWDDWQRRLPPGARLFRDLRAFVDTLPE
ncbi:MAG TPA: HAD-IIIA family hydrolase [Candidatus Synoicihabitans sp.]|nr:HAD-IIIA family hydrolase [Candidatus Synoicihabitans sp.]